MPDSLRSAQRLRLPVLAAPSDVIVDTLVAQPDQWFRVAGADYCRQPEDHAPECRCSIRVLTQTAYRIRERALGAFASVQEGCFQARALSSASRPDRVWPVEIKARWTRACP